MNFLQYPRVRVVIVVLITTVIAIGIGLLMSSLLTPPPKKCSGDTHLDENTNKCVPNCQDGYKNDPITGECVIDCPDGEVSSKSISGVTIPGKERCVLPCGSGYCDPETDKTVCQDGVCYEPNCKTTDDKASHCTPPLLCGTDSNGKKKTNLPSGTTLDANGCYKHNSPIPPPAPVCPSATPNLVTGTDAYSKEHVCCKTTEFGIYTKQGEPFCCPDEDDVIIDRKCCPKAQQCTFGGKTVCLTTDQVCTPEGPCKTEYAIGSDGKYTGCCPFPTSNGDCYNMCTYVGTSDTGMKDKCSTDADCDFKSGFKFDGIPTAGGKCDNGTCKLYCGPADAATQGDISCLNDPNSKNSTCINTSAMCKFTENSYSPPMNNGAYICNDDTVKPPASYWQSTSGAPTLTVSAGMETPANCTALSCLDRMITNGLLGATGEITKGGKQRTLPTVSGTNTPSIKDSTCTATIECNKMQLLQNGSKVEWSDQTVNKNNQSVVMNTLKSNVFNGSYSGDGLCNPGATPGSCIFLPSGKFSNFGTYDGVNLAGNKLSGTGCAPASWGNPKQTYPSGILCSVNTSNNPSGGYSINPNYYCTSWSACCGEGGLISSSDYNKCVCLANATNVNGICEYNTASNGAGIISAHNPATAAGWPPSGTIRNAAYLSLQNTMSPTWVETQLGSNNHMNVKYSHAVVVMSYNGQYIGFNSDKNLGTVSSNSPINFYYTYYDGQNVWPYGQIPIVKGFFRFGTGKAYDSRVSNNDLGRPVRVNNKLAIRDPTWGGTTQFDNGDILTLVKSSGKWYLAGTKCFYWKSGLTYGIQDGDGKLVYGTYNSSTKIFEFITNDPKTATPIDINYVFSAIPGASTNSDDQFLSGINTKTIIAQAGADSKFALTFSGLAGKVKSSV